MVALTHAEVLISEEMQDKFGEEWKQVRDSSLDRRQKVLNAALKELKKSGERHTAEMAKSRKSAGLDNVCTDSKNMTTNS
jgi:hypothetical protein